MSMEYAPWIFSLAKVFEKAGAPLYLVGGAVRNPLMGLPVSDIDACGPALPLEVLGFCEGTEVRPRLRAAHFGTVELHVTETDGTRHMAEYTTFREDSYRCGHQPSEVRFTTDMGVDALRRDFSVNALYRLITETGPGEIVDPTGGLAHLCQGILHTVTADPDQVLKDDGLRIFRAARFQAELGLTPTGSLLASAEKYAALLNDIAPERLRDELEKILLADFRYPGLARRAPATASGLITLQQIGAWQSVFPSFPFCANRAAALQRLVHQRKVSPLAERLALLLGGEEREAVGQSLRALRFAEKECEQAALLVGAAQWAAKLQPDIVMAARLGVSAMEFVQNAFRALAETMSTEEQKGMQAAAGHGAAMLQRLLSGVPLSLQELAVNGNDLRPLLECAHCPMREMGALLSALWESTVKGCIPNEQEALLRAAEEWLTIKDTGQRGFVEKPL